MPQYGAKVLAYTVFDHRYGTFQTGFSVSAPKFEVTSQDHVGYPNESWALIQPIGTTFSSGDPVKMAEFDTLSGNYDANTIESATFEGGVDLDSDGFLDSAVVSMFSQEYILSDADQYIDFTPYSTEVTLDRASLDLGTEGGSVEPNPVADTTAPHLTSLEIPEKVSVSEGSAPLVISAAGFDDLAGISALVIWFEDEFSRSYSSNSESYYSFSLLEMRDEGDWKDGISTEDWGISPQNLSGTINVTEVDITDVDGNSRTYSAKDLAQMGVNTSIEIVSSVGRELTGNGRDNSLVGTLGDDTLTGRGGDDTLRGWSGADTLQGNGGHDTLIGGGGADTLWGGRRGDMLHGKGGHDSLSGDKGWDALHGGGGDDALDGGGGRDELYGGNGADALRAGAGADQLNGNSGSDTLLGNGGDDVLRGGQGGDTLHGQYGDDTLNGSKGADELRGGVGHDGLSGGNGRDVLYGSKHGDVLRGNGGRDELSGDKGWDKLHGGRGDDVLDGGDGRDTLHGRGGDDVLTGGNGVDTFVFATFRSGETDTVTDFADGRELMRMVGVDGLEALSVSDG